MGNLGSLVLRDATCRLNELTKGLLMANPDSDRMTVRCPCGAKLKLPGAVAGRKACCPKCKEVFTIPAWPAAAEATTEALVRESLLLARKGVRLL